MLNFVCVFNLICGHLHQLETLLIAPKQTKSFHLHCNDNHGTTVMGLIMTNENNIHLQSTCTQSAHLKDKWAQLKEKISANALRRYKQETINVMN